MKMTIFILIAVVSLALWYGWEHRWICSGNHCERRGASYAYPHINPKDENSACSDSDPNGTYKSCMEGFRGLKNLQTGQEFPEELLDNN